MVVLYIAPYYNPGQHIHTGSMIYEGPEPNASDRRRVPAARRGTPPRWENTGVARAVRRRVMYVFPDSNLGPPAAAAVPISIETRA